VKVPDLASGVGSWVTRRLLHVDLFMQGEFTIQIGTFDVDLVKFKIQVGSHGKNGMV
jgi:hypothetical protein